MPRKYKKVVYGRPYQRYASENLEKAVNDIKEGKMSLRVAAQTYNVPKSTLCDRLNLQGDTHRSPGGQPVLSKEEETTLCEGLLKCAEWGFPLRVLDVQLVVQSYLNRCGKTVKRFKNNCPGVEWVRSFLGRQQVLTVRLGENVKRARAAIDVQTVSEYFDNLEEAIRDIEPSNIINYDETNFCDDPGKTRVIVKRGTKHAEVIKDTSKTSTSVMMAASGSGELLPPYIVYKATHLYPTWIEGGISGARYNRNPTGWFDMEIFDDWFLNTCVPYLKTLQGPKVIIGDNLSSHISLETIKQCENFNIRFIVLPPNSTHLCQPLDVAFFRPMKVAWRKCLDEWKRKNYGTLPKSEFPKMLKKAMEIIEASAKENVRSGFRATGIVPLDRNRVLAKIPDPGNGEPENDRKAWTEAFTMLLQEARFRELPKSKPRGKKMAIAAGKSVSSSDLTTHEETASCSNEQPREELNHNDEAHVDVGTENLQSYTLDPQDFILVKFHTNKRDRFYIGQIICLVGDNPCQYQVKFLRKKASKKDTYFIFPDITDECTVNDTQVVRKLKPPTDLRRGRFMFKGIDISYIE